MNHQKVIDTIQSKNKGGKLLLVAVGGSQSYGLATPTSDWDYKGICFAPARSYIGIGNVFEQIEFKDADAEFEGTVYEIRKWLGLAAACNPNIVEMLFTNEEHHVFRNDLDGMEFLMENREKFITKKAQHTFSGYAHAQLKRIKTHRNWLLNPLGSKPKRTDYGLSANHKAGKNLLESSQGALVALEERGAEAGLSESAISLLRAEQTYKNDLDHWNQYQHWLRTRNKARAALEAKCGYDSKHGMHLVRLLRMCTEILETGKIYVNRTHIDREELLEIRNGAWSYDRLIEHAESLQERCKAAAKTSTLPESVDMEWLNTVCMSLVEGAVFRS